MPTKDLFLNDESFPGALGGPEQNQRTEHCGSIGLDYFWYMSEYDGGYEDEVLYDLSERITLKSMGQMERSLQALIERRTHYEGMDIYVA